MRKKLIILSLLGGLSITIIAYAKNPELFAIFKNEGTSKVTTAQTRSKKGVYDPALLLRLDKVFKNFDTGRPAYTLSGSVDMINKADTSEKMRNVDFLISKAGDKFYYKMGKTEVINENGICLNINIVTKKVFITEKKQVTTFKMLDVDKLREVLQTEEYQLLSTNSGKSETISLINEKHFSCKEYAITFDTLSKKVTEIAYRLAYAMEPQNKNKEKTIDIKITQCDSTANIDLYNTKSKVIDKSGKLTAKYSGYKLIHL